MRRDASSLDQTVKRLRRSNAQQETVEFTGPGTGLDVARAGNGTEAVVIGIVVEILWVAAALPLGTVYRVGIGNRRGQLLRGRMRGHCPRKRRPLRILNFFPQSLPCAPALHTWPEEEYVGAPVAA